jgi:hypothetical protein
MIKQVIEVELRDRTGNTFLRDQKDAHTGEVIRKFEKRIYEEVGGMLCLDHFSVPHCSPEYSNRRWVVKITCCCEHQMDAVENRLYNAFN